MDAPSFTICHTVQYKCDMDSEKFQMALMAFNTVYGSSLTGVEFIQKVALSFLTKNGDMKVERWMTDADLEFYFEAPVLEQGGDVMVISKLDFNPWCFNLPFFHTKD